MPYLKELNERQKEAVTIDDGPTLVLAGAGSGKTRVLTTRICFLVDKKGVKTNGIVAVTFTNKAAGEMRERLKTLLGASADSLLLGTFHSLGMRILKRHGGLIGIDRDFTIYDDDDQMRLIKHVMEELGISEKATPVRTALSRISSAKNENLSPDEYIRTAGDYMAEKIFNIYSLYQKRLREMNALDFGDLICEPIRLFKTHPQILDKYQNAIRHVLVDEYQDTNRAQYILMNQLAGEEGNIYAVGDPDQSIYAWRGANIRNILDFEQTWKGVRVLRLEQNYRSTRHILSAANSVIENNKERYKKTLWTENTDGLKVKRESFNDEYEEAERIVCRISELRSNESYRYKDFAIFYRTNAQSRVFEERLNRYAIPYTIVGGTRFYQRQEIRDVIAYLRVVSNPRDAMSLKRIINVPTRGVGAATLTQAERFAEKNGITLYESFKELLADGIIKKSGVKDFFAAMDEIRGEHDKLPLHELAIKLLKRTGYMDMWKNEGGEDSYGRVENVQEFISAMKNFSSARETPTLSDFLMEVALVSDVDSYEDKKNSVTIMTIHSAKGLEFPVVFIAGMEEGLFPHARSKENDELEEERRLCYVAMTRARERLFLCSAKTRTIFGELRYETPSRFISEIPDEFMDGAEVAVREESCYTIEDVKEVSSAEPYYSLEGVDIDPYADEWNAGMKVKHPKFGIGIVKAREGSGGDAKVTVIFLNGEKKKLIVKYAQLLAV